MNRLDTLEPDFRAQVEALIESIEQQSGRKWGVVSGRRTMAEQRKLYAQGRSTPGKVVTNAPPGNSAHNFGLAVDLCPYTLDGKDFDWGAPKTLFKAMADIAKRMGLNPGFYFHSIFDAPHVESMTWRKQQALWKEGKIQVA